MTVYKLRRISDGWFVGNDGCFSKKGKTWNSLAAVRSHIAHKERQARSSNDYFRAGDYLNSIELVEYELTEKGILPLIVAPKQKRIKR